MSNSTEKISKLRLLVVIACFGNKQLEYLKRIMATYQSMAMSVDIVVVSNIPRDLGKDIKVVVGLPSKNPHSLPFAHKAVLAENVDRYDLFVYTEDDILVTETNIQAFLRATRVLPENEIAGHLRYELDKAGQMWLPDIFAHYHWKPESVTVRGGDIFAEFTNEHAGFYVVTQSQLKRAIGSGGFLRAPYHGRYGMLESAATNLFTNCGLRRVICVSQMDDFMVHHMSNRYAGKSGVPRETLNQQIQVLAKIQSGNHPASSLCPLESKMPKTWWSKTYYEKPQEELIQLVPKDAKDILSVGCGWGATEAALKRRGANVTGLPVDSVLGAIAAQSGVEVIYGTLDEGLKKLAGRKFDCLLMTDLLHLLPQNARIIEQCLGLLRKGGTLLVSGPNFTRLPSFVRRAAAWGDYRKLNNFDQSGITVCGPGMVMKHARNAGLRVAAVKWFNHQLPGRRLAEVQMELGRLTAKNWIVQVRQ